MIAIFLIVLIGGAFIIAVLGSDMVASASWHNRPKPPDLLKIPPAPADARRSGAAPDDVEMADRQDQKDGGARLMGNSKPEGDGL